MAGAVVNDVRTPLSEFARATVSSFVNPLHPMRMRRINT